MAGILQAPRLGHANRYVMVDVETTGLAPSQDDRIIEIGAVAVERNRIQDEFHTLINIGKRIPLAARQIHGITDEMLSGGPKPEEVYPLFHKFISGCILVAHNAKFDIGFLLAEFGRLGLGCNNRHQCTLEMSRARYPRLPNHKLETVYRHLCGKNGVEIQAHRALADARMVAAIWMEMMNKSTV